jgi:hypothetical protein
VLLAACLLGCGETKDRRPKAARDSKPGLATAPKESPIVVTTEQLQAEYEADKEAADRKYKDRPMEISGTVEEFRWDDPDHPLCVFLTKFDENKINVACSFAKMPTGVGWELVAGQKVRLRGECNGNYYGPMVGLVQCLVLEASPSLAPVVSAAELAKDYTDAKYKDKSIFLEGTVLDTDPRTNSCAILFQTADAPFAVVASLPSPFSRAVANLKVGETVQIRGVCDGTHEFALELNERTVGLRVSIQRASLRKQKP